MPAPFLVETDAELRRCFPVMQELRPHLTSADDFLEQVRRQQRSSGYQLLALDHQAEIVAVAGFRITEALAWGRYLYVDDLVAAASHRFQGHGQVLLDWLLEYARGQNCVQFHLDSGVQRFEAHGFYLKNRLHITSHHFSRPVR